MDDGANDAITILDIGELINSHDENSSNYSCSLQWADEEFKNPYTNERCQHELHLLATNPHHRAKCYWAARKAHRRFRFAKRKFCPRSRFKARKIGKRMKKRGPPSTRNFCSGAKKPFRKHRRGFFLGRHFVSLDHIEESELSA